jgi:hypothetical protein
MAKSSNKMTPPMPHAKPNAFNLTHYLEKMRHYNGFTTEAEKSFTVTQSPADRLFAGSSYLGDIASIVEVRYDLAVNIRAYFPQTNIGQLHNDFPHRLAFDTGLNKWV